MKNDPNGASFVSSEEALRQTRSALLAIPEAEVLREARVDVRHAFGVVTASVQHLAAHRAALIALCGPETGELLDRLPIAAAATEHTALLVQMADIGDRVPALREVARRQHRLVFGDAMALVRRGRLKEAAIEHLRVVASDAQLIQALSGLALVLRREWPQIEAHTPLTLDALEETARAGRQLDDALLERTVGHALTAARDLHARAITRLLVDYDELRRRVHYLRWHVGDADRLAPSPFARRKKRRRDRSDVEPPREERAT